MKTETKPTHTPKPWYVDGSFHEGDEWIISESGAPSGTPVAQCFQEDAAFIVRAVNSHQRYLDAIKAVANSRTEAQFDDAIQECQAIAKAEGR